MRRIIIIPVLLAGALALAGCSASGGSSASAPQPDTAVGSSSGGVQGLKSENVDGAADSTGSGTSTGTAASTAERDTVITGSVDLTAVAPLTAAAKVTSIADRAGGRVDARSEQAADGRTPASASLTIRVPSAKVDEVIAAVRNLGSDARVVTTSADVTSVHQDTAARIDALQDSIARLETFLAATTNVSDLIKIESEISDRQADLESLQAQQRGLDDQISLATLRVGLTAPTAPVRQAPGSFGDGVAVGWSAFTAFVGWCAVALGVALPWLVLAGLVLAVVVGIRRLRRRRTDHAAIPPAAG